MRGGYINWGVLSIAMIRNHTVFHYMSQRELKKVG